MTSGGRRIKRSLSIKLNSVSYLSKNQIDKLKNIELLSDYLITREKDINDFNRSRKEKDTLITAMGLITKSPLKVLFQACKLS